MWAAVGIPTAFFEGFADVCLPWESHCPAGAKSSPSYRSYRAFNNQF